MYVQENAFTSDVKIAQIQDLENTVIVLLRITICYTYPVSRALPEISQQAPSHGYEQTAGLRLTKALRVKNPKQASVVGHGEKIKHPNPALIYVRAHVVT